MKEPKSEAGGALPPANWAPDRIWLQRGMGDNGAHTWCEDSIGGEVEEVEYVRVFPSRENKERRVSPTR